MVTLRSECAGGARPADNRAGLLRRARGAGRREWFRTASWPVFALAVLHLCVAPGCSHEGVNICAHDERPMTATAKRLSCKQDAKCVHETQCGCIPQGCTCGDAPCIYAGHGQGDDGDVEPADSHAHDGKRHTHTGGDRPHHHADDGSIVYDGNNAAEPEVAKEAAPHHHADDGSVVYDGNKAAEPEVAKEAGEPAEDGARKHELVDDDGEGPTHTHADGTQHGHPGGDMPHHHDKDGSIVFDVPNKGPPKKAKFVMNKGPLLPPHQHKAKDADGDAIDADAIHDAQPSPAAAGSGKKGVTGDASSVSPPATHGDDGAASSASGDRLGMPSVNSTGTRGGQATSEIRQRMAGVLLLVLGMGIFALMMAACCTCFGSAFVRCFKHKVLGKSMLSKDMFNDKEMMCMDWESKSNAAGWRHDDGL